LTEKRIRLLFVVLVVGQLLLISAQVPAAAGRHSVLADLSLRAVAPLASAVATAQEGLATFAVRWTTRRRLLTENAELRRDNEALRRRALEEVDVRGDLQRLSQAVAYSQRAGKAIRLADVVYLDRTSWTRTLLLRLGDDGARHNQPVVTDGGLVGRIVEVSGRYGKVQLILDRVASVGVMVERTRRQGIVRGEGSNRLALRFIPLQSDLRVGDRIVTAGIDGVYPRGIPVGEVTRAEPGTELFYDAELTPAVDFAAVDHVYILESESVPAGLRDAAGRSPEGEP
jgi:rod shape-determining protein MreC